MTNYTKITDNDLASGALYDKVNDMADAINAGKLERTAAGVRKASTTYTAGDLVFCEYHANLILKCTTAGTTGVGALDTSGSLSAGDTITDGTVVWTAIVNGTVNAVNGISPNSSGNIDIASANETFTGTNKFTTVHGLQAKQPLILKENNDKEGGQIEFEGADNESNTGKIVAIDRYDGKLRVLGKQSDDTDVAPFVVDIENNSVDFSPNAKQLLVSMIMPNYSAASAISNTGSFTATSNGYAFITITGAGYETHAYVNSVDVAIGWYTNTGVGNRTCVPMKKGDTLTWDTGRISNPVFVPCLGG